MVRTYGGHLMLPDETSPTFFWNNIEISVGVMTACTPTYRPLWLYWKRKGMVASKLTNQHFSIGSRFPFLRVWQSHGSNIGDEDNAHLKQDTSVNTFIESGNIESRDDMTLGGIAVRHEIHTDNGMQPFDHIV